MFGVDRQQLRAGGLGEFGDQFATDHEALLVGQGDVDATTECGDRRPQAGGADDAVQDQVGLGGGDQVHGRVRSGEHGAGEGLFGSACRVGIGHGNDLGTGGLGGFNGLLPVDADGHADRGQVFTTVDYFQCLGAYRTRGPEQSDSFHPLIFPEPLNGT